MTLDSNSVPRRPRGRPALPVPDGRDLASETKALVEWFKTHPAVKPGIISRAANLHPQALGAILRGERRPKASDIDAVNEALKPYR